MAQETFDTLESLLKKYPEIPLGKSIDISNHKYNRLTPLVRVKVKNKSNGAARWACKCDCGKYIIALGSQVTSGHTNSCGCYNKEIVAKQCKILGQRPKNKDYTKKENPYYNFIRPLDKKNSNNSIVWEIQCKNCGKIYEGIPAEIVSYTRRRGNNPCACWQNLSKGEEKIKQILLDNNIKFLQEYIFKDFVYSDTNNHPRFDFFVNDSYLIKYDGEQHFLPMSFGDTKNSGEAKLLKTQQHDKIKNEYCKIHNIPLIRIPYIHYNDITINDLLLSTSNFIV